MACRQGATGIGELEAAVDSFEATEEHMRKLWALVEPLGDGHGHEETPRALLVLGKAYYHLEELQRAIGTLRRSSEPEATLWLAYSYFDRGDYRPADEALVQALSTLPLADWTRAKLHELRCCCKLRLAPSDVGIEDIRCVRQARDSVDEEHRPVPQELAAALTAMARDVPALVLRYAEKAFGAEFAEWGLAAPWAEARPS